MTIKQTSKKIQSSEKDLGKKLEMKLRVRFNCSSRMAQRKRAGPITQRSVDRNYLLLKETLDVQKITSNIPWNFFMSKTVSSKLGKIKATEQIQFQFGNQTARKISADHLQTHIKHSLIFRLSFEY